MPQKFASITLAILILSGAGFTLQAQKTTDPGKALVRSLLVPGWGHYYVDSENWGRGQIHLGTEAVLIASYFGLRMRANRIDDQIVTLAMLKAGVDISGRSRSFQLAIGDYNSLSEYNDFQLRARRWNRLFEPTPENSWYWSTNTDRERYNDLQSDEDRIRNQLPALLSLMAVNRIISGLSAYQRARNATSIPQISLIPVSTTNGDNGVIARVSFRF